jgi:hypothetical protein
MPACATHAHLQATGKQADKESEMSATDKPFRVIATGLRGGRANIAFDQALIEARREEKIPDTIRFLRFRPSALIGIHQYLCHELKLDYCKAHASKPCGGLLAAAGFISTKVKSAGNWSSIARPSASWTLPR